MHQSKVTHKGRSKVLRKMHRRKSSEINRIFDCPIENCNCSYGEMKLLKRHFHIKHSEKLVRYPDMISHKRSWKRPASIKYRCCVLECSSTYGTRTNLNQHIRTEHPEIYHKYKKIPNEYHPSVNEEFDNNNLCILANAAATK